MEECHRQIREVAGKQKDKVDELSAEIRKMKAMTGENVFLTFLVYKLGTSSMNSNVTRASDKSWNQEHSLTLTRSHSFTLSLNHS